MGKTGGSFLSLIGAAISFVPGLQFAGFALMTAGGAIAQNAAKKEAMEKARELMRGMRLNTRTTERPIPVIYGRQRVGGNVVWMSSDGKGPNDYDPPRNKLFVLYGVSEGPIDGFEEIHFNDTKVWDARSGQLKTQFYNKFYAEFRTGTNSQAPFSHVATYHNLYDVASETFPLTAMALVELFYDQDVYQAIPNVTFTIRGKQVPDWTDVSSPGVLKWYQSGPLQTADMMTNPIYGMGISSANLNLADVRSSHAYATAAIAPGSREILEVVDTSTQRPKYFERDIQIFVNKFSLESGPDTSSLFTQVFTDKVPIKPGSLSFSSMQGSLYYDSPRSGMISQFGRILGAGAAQVGSVNYLTGNLVVDRPPFYDDGINTINVFTWTAKWYADWEFSFRTKYQNIARSLYIVSTPETLVETGTVASNIINLYSSQGGGGTVDYSTGEINAYFGAHEWYDNNPIEIRYRVQTRQRFATNFPLYSNEKMIDALRGIQQHYRGFLVYQDGKYGIKVEQPGASVFSFDDDNILAGTFRIHQPSVKEIPSKVVLKYLDGLNAFTPAEASFDVRSVDPGAESEHVLSMPGITARDEAMALAYTYANLASLPNTIEFSTNYNAIGVEAGDVVDVTHPSAGWSEKLFRVVSIAFGRDDRLDIVAVEHDTTAYVDDWIQGPMESRNPSFFPRRSYWPPNVTSATITELSRTLADGTSVPAIKYDIYAVDSANLHVAYWNIYAFNATRGQVRKQIYSGVNTTGYIYPVEQGVHGVSIYAVSDFGNESARAWVGSLTVGGLPEYDWQNWRADRVDGTDNFNAVSGHIPSMSDAFIDSSQKRWLLWNTQSFTGATGAVKLGLVEGSKVSTMVTVGSFSFDVSPFDCLGIVQNSGGCITPLWSTTSGIVGATWSASLTCINTTTWVATDISSFTCYAFASNSANVIYSFGYGKSSASSQYIGYRVISCNLASATVVNCIGAKGDYSNSKRVFSSCFVQSYGILSMLQNCGTTLASSHVQGFKWVFDHGLSTFYSAGTPSAIYGKADLYLSGRIRTTFGGMRACIGGARPERIVMLTDGSFLPNVEYAAWGKHIGYFDCRTHNPASGTLERLESAGDDFITGTDAVYYVHLTGRPGVSSNFIIAAASWPVMATVTSYSLNVDVWHYYRVLSVSPITMQTWL